MADSIDDLFECFDEAVAETVANGDEEASQTCIITEE